MPLTTTSTITGPVNVDFQMNLLRTARANCPYLFGTMPADIAEHSGTFTAKWRRYENLTPTTTPLAELSGAVAFPTRTGSQPTITDVTATVQKYGDFFYLNEEVDLLNYNNQGAAARAAGITGAAQANVSGYQSGVNSLIGGIATASNLYNQNNILNEILKTRKS